ncbi:ABC transporter permease [uncultured Desulfosarcina sp.]|uniref:ABC transporter permease n=1 Tax=uncultured Desulfosarcina sp. TaxID=218289 RepID=UPI0029C84C61|nr:ABC transporter permease [uncultured Desulfosarcina sp.]
MMRLQRLIAVVRKEFIHILRDWRSLVLAIAIPMLLIALFGYALTMDLKHVPTAIRDQSRTAESRQFISLLEGSAYFSIDRYTDDPAALADWLDAGKIMVALTLPADFADCIRAGRPVAVQAIIDGADANNASLAAGYLEAIGLIYNRSLTVAGNFRSGMPGTVSLEPRAWYNPELESRNVIIPGIIALVMVVIAAMLTSVTIAREWETGTMEQLISTPIRVPELVIGKVVPYFVIGLIDVAIAVAMGSWIFDVPLRGSPALLFLSASVFLTGALFLGLLLSINLKSQVLANQLAVFTGYLPTLLLSGFVFGIYNMPTAIQAITFIVPARYFIALLKGIFLKGIGLEVLGLNMILLTVYAAIMVVLCHRKMKLKL